MRGNFIKKVNRSLKDSRPFLPTDKICNVFQSGDLLEIGFMSGHCKRDYGGSCLMCDYGRTDIKFPVTQYIDEMLSILSKYQNGINFLLICCNGSFFDESQISTELLKAILVQTQNCYIPNIIIESHYEDITVKKLEIIKSIIKKPLIIEMGFETANQEYQNKIIMKGVELNKFERTINLILQYGFKIELNIMLGLPFLSAKEQLLDAKKSINWVIAHKCEPVVFPINIKPHTLLRYAYEKGFYKPVSAWLIIKFLEDLDTEALSKSIIAWYGNRDEPYADDVPTVLPVSCEKCKQKLIDFGLSFLNEPNYAARKGLLTKLKKTTLCDCYHNLEEEINCKTQPEFNYLYKAFYECLKTDFKNISKGAIDD